MGLLAFLISWLIQIAAAEAGDLRTEPALNQGDLTTGEVFRKGEWSYNQPPLFAPGWMRWGVTDRLTIQLDFMAWLGGLPDMNARVALKEPRLGEWALAWETMYLHFDASRENLNDLDDNDDHLFVQRDGPSGFTKLALSVPFAGTWWFHGALGVSYSEYYRVENENRGLPARGREFKALWDPVAILGIETRPAAHWAIHGGIAYGETFLFRENRPRKLQLTYGARFAPWLDREKAWLKNLRIEINAVNVFFHDANEGRATGIPVVPYVYWQWRN